MKINANSFFDLFKKKDNDDDNNNNNGESGGGNKQLDEWPSIFGDDDEQIEGADGPGWNAMKNWYNENKVCRLGFNPTSRNWDIESKLAKVA